MLFQLNSVHQPSTTGHLLVTDHPEDKAVTITVNNSQIKSMSPCVCESYCKWIQNYGTGITYYKENIMVLYVCLYTECWCDNVQTSLLVNPFTGHDSVSAIPYPHTTCIPKININIPSSSWSTKWTPSKSFSHLSSIHIHTSPPLQPHTQPVYS